MGIRDLARQHLAKSASQSAFHVSSPRSETVKQRVSPVSAYETALKQSLEVDFEERAAISEFEGGLSREQAECLASLQTINPPAGISTRQLAEIIDLAAHRLDQQRRRATRIRETMG